MKKGSTLPRIVLQTLKYRDELKQKKNHRFRSRVPWKCKTNESLWFISKASGIRMQSLFKTNFSDLLMNKVQLFIV